jgi:hypothetical protein
MVKAGQGCHAARKWVAAISATSYVGTAAPGCPAEPCSVVFSFRKNRVEPCSTEQLRTVVPMWFVVKASGVRLGWLRRNILEAFLDQPSHSCKHSEPTQKAHDRGNFCVVLQDA